MDVPQSCPFDMMAAWVFSGAFLLAVLSWDVCCFPAKQGYFDPRSSYGSGYNVNFKPAAPTYIGSKQTAPTSSQFPPGAFIPGVAPSKSVSKPAPYQPVPQRRPTPSYSSSSFSGPLESGYRGNSSPSEKKSPPGSTKPSASSQPGLPKDFPWAIAPNLFVAEKTSTSPDAPRFGASKLPRRLVRPGNVSPPHPLPPTVSDFQPGEMSHMEGSFEHGGSESETEEQGFQPPPPGFVSPSQPHPEESLTGNWGVYPYDWMFLAGLYPPGTITHHSSSYEQGRDHWHDAHYVRDRAPFNPNAEQLIQTYPYDFASPWSQSEVQSPVNAGYGDAEVGHNLDQDGAGSLSAHSYGSYETPSRFVEQLPQMSSEAGGYNLGKFSGY